MFKTPTTSGRTVGAGGPFFLLPVDHHSVYSYMNILIFKFGLCSHLEIILKQNYLSLLVLMYLLISLLITPPAVAKKLSRFGSRKKITKKTIDER